MMVASELGAAEVGREPPPRAEQALQEAAQATQALEQKQALNAAADQQQKLAEALNELLSEPFDLTGVAATG